MGGKNDSIWIQMDKKWEFFLCGGKRWVTIRPKFMGVFPTEVSFWNQLKLAFFFFEDLLGCLSDGSG